MLNPETSSDSPSAKSKGVRFVSARIEANHAKNRGATNSIGSWCRSLSMVETDSDVIMISGVSRISTILTSYEIVWATLRRAPKRAYLEFEDHPAPKVVYTFRLEIIRKNRALKQK